MSNINTFSLKVNTFFEIFSLTFNLKIVIIDIMKGIDLKIKRIRLRVNMQTLSKKMGKSIGWLSNVENDRVKLTPKIIKFYTASLSKIKNGKSNG